MIERIKEIIAYSGLSDRAFVLNVVWHKIHLIGN